MNFRHSFKIGLLIRMYAIYTDVYYMDMICLFFLLFSIFRWYQYHKNSFFWSCWPNISMSELRCGVFLPTPAMSRSAMRWCGPSVMAFHAPKYGENTVCCLFLMAILLLLAIDDDKILPLICFLFLMAILPSGYDIASSPWKDPPFYS